MTFEWSRNIGWESSHIYFFCGGDPFCEVERRLENTQGEPTGLFEWPADFPLRLSAHRVSLFQSKIIDFILSFQVPYESASSPAYFLFMAGYRNLHTSVFSGICWFYLQTEISVTLSIGNKLYSSQSSFIFSFLWNHFVDVILRPHWIC